MGPDVDDLVVTLAVSDEAFTILLLDLADLFVSVLKFGLFFLRNNHVRDSDRDAGPGRFGKYELFQIVERCHGRGWSGDLITTPNDVTELLLPLGSIEETEFLRPNLIEDNTPRRGLDRFGIAFSKNGLIAEVRIFETDAIVRFDRAFGHREFDFHRLGKERQMAVFLNAARVLRHIIKAQRDVL